MNFNECEPTGLPLQPDLFEQGMNICIDGCEDIACCDKCGKQLCQIEEFQNGPTVKKQCVNEGYYNLRDERFCIKCYKTRW